jgi:hypothetical protein
MGDYRIHGIESAKCRCNLQEYVKNWPRIVRNPGPFLLYATPENEENFSRAIDPFRTPEALKANKRGTLLGFAKAFFMGLWRLIPIVGG